MLAAALPLAPVIAMVPAYSAERQSQDAETPDARFEKIYTDEYSWRISRLPPGEENQSADPLRLPDVGPQEQAAKLARWTATAALLADIDPATLSPANQINYEVYKDQIDALIAQQRYRDYEKPFNADTSFWGEVAVWSRETFTRPEEYENYLAMLREIPRYYDQQIANMRAGIARGFTAPRITLAGRDSEIVAVVEAATPEESPFYAPFREMPASMPEARKAELRAQAVAAIRDAVKPAHAKLLTFMREEYTPAARTSLDAYSLPDGRAYYQSKIREFVTLDLTADQIHQIGLDEVAKIRARMMDVIRQVGFEGSFAEFLEFLRTDPQFYAKTPQELLDRAAWTAKSFDGVASRWFGHLPRARFGIIPVPPEIAPFYTGGRGGPGVYLVNTYNLPSRPLYSLPALTLHESAPGHAFQMPLAAENKDLPAFRRDTYISAYGEGWALYSEALGEEMGMYTTPYELFGMLSYQMWRATRLVVDTGIHTKGWSREQAQQYMLDNTALARHEIETEVDRYISWPGQALSYYMGALTIRQERARAEAALGDKFNIRAFHDTVLALGSVPMSLLKQRIDRFIADGGAGPYPDEE
ncbi:MAG: DUF885 domain-containing protein [Sphingomonas sp.]|nr:DUF885 domain-containing protein [Sphingomonas sp.]